MAPTPNPSAHTDLRMVRDACQAILDLANMKVRMICPDGRRRTISLIEARLIELASPDCRRRIMCEEFIRQVRAALRISTRQSDGASVL